MRKKAKVPFFGIETGLSSRCAGQWIVRAAVVLVFFMMPSAARGVVYHVAPDGDDGDSGSATSPWRTITRAVAALSPGDEVIVADGNYDEIVTVAHGGTSEASRITIRAASQRGAKCRGFVVTGDYVTIDGFDVEADTTSWRGVYIDAASHVRVQHCYVHECPMGGIIATHGAAYVEILDNLLYHNGQLGIELVGSHGLIEGNEISETVQHHPKGEEPGFTGADADGMRVFGDHHLVRRNFIHDIANPDDPGNSSVSGQMPHADCLQTWNAARPVMTDTVIEGNHCRVHHISGKGIEMSSQPGVLCHDIIIRNNLFEYRDIGIHTSEGPFERIWIYNNTFKSDLGASSWSCSIALRDVVDYLVQNNISVDAYEHRHIVGGSGTVSHNLLWNSDGSLLRATPGEQQNEWWGDDPLFVQFDWVPGGTWENLDYHLRDGSPALDVGIALPDLVEDFDGVSRPQGGGVDLGAFEYIDSTCVSATCGDLGYVCGDWPDGCGGTLHCGSCGEGEECGSSGQCVSTCAPSCGEDFDDIAADASNAEQQGQSNNGCGCSTPGSRIPVRPLLFLFLVGLWLRRLVRGRLRG